MNDSKTAFKSREQLVKFLGIFSPHISKPTEKFVGEMLFGIQASQDTLLSEIGRSLREDIRLKKTEERLCRHLAKAGLDEKLHLGIVEDAKRFIGERTIISIDPTDIQKDYAEKMPYLDKVWDGSKGRVGDNLGYWCCMAVACENGCRRIVPLHLRLWSVKAPGYVSEGDEVQQVIMQVALATSKRGIYVYDRGGDGDVMFAFFLENALDFIVRLVGDRHLVDWGTRKVLARDLAAQCVLKYEDSVHFKSHNKVHNVRVQYGSMPVRLPDYPDRELRLVVVKWPKSEGRMMLLTTLEAVRTRESLWEVVQGYLTRWRVEDTLRYIKTSYNVEHVRVLDYQRLKNMAALIAAVAYFAAAWLGRQLKLGVLAEHIAKVSKRMFDVPEFFYYAIADGLKWLFVSHGKWRGPGERFDGKGDLQMELEFADG